MTSIWFRNSGSLFHQYANPSLSTRTTAPSPDLIPLRHARISPVPDLTTNRAVRSLEAFDSLHNVTEELDRITLQNMKDAWKNQELSDILDDFEKRSPLTSELCFSMIDSSRHAIGHHSDVKSALDSFQEQHFAVSDEDGNFKNFSRCFIENIWMAVQPFPVDYVWDFKRVYSTQIAVMARLEAKRMKLEHTIDRVIVRRKIAIRIFVATFGLVLAGSVMSVYVKAPAGLTALIAAVTIPLGWTGRWLNSTWKKLEWNFREQREIISVMQVGSDIVFQELGGITSLVERFQIETEDLLAYMNLTTWGDNAGLVIAMEEIKKKVDGIFKTIDDLSVQANNCTQEAKSAKTLILRRINLNHPVGGSNHEIAMCP